MHRLLVTLLLVLSAVPASAAVEAGMFGQGRTSFSLVGGNAYAFDNYYFVIGASASYYVRDGLGVGLSLEKWSGANPAISKYAPFMQYVFYQESSLQPYVGGFYRHTVIEGLPNINSVGGRAGVNFITGSNSFASIGLVYETYLDCQQAVYRSCSSSYPDFSLTFGF